MLAVNKFTGWYLTFSFVCVSFQSRRGTFIRNAASWILIVDVSLRDVEFLAGYSSLGTTQCYIEVTCRRHAQSQIVEWEYVEIYVTNLSRTHKFKISLGFFYCIFLEFESFFHQNSSQPEIVHAMKRTLFATTSFFVMISSAFAADLPTHKETLPTPPIPPMWTGFYAGLNSGYGFGTANNAQNYGWANSNNLLGSGVGKLGPVAFALANSYMGHDITQGGFIGGGQVGYNYLLSQKFIIGLETDMQGAGIGGQGNANGWAPYNQNNGGVESFVGLNPIQAGVNWMGTVRGRAGYLISPTVMTYVTAGLAYGGTYIKTFPTMIYASSIGGSYFDPVYVSTQNSQQNVNVGWTAGGGAEWMVAQNWSIKGEALYYNLSSTSVSNTTYYGSSNYAAFNPVGGSVSRAYYQGVIARAGLNYHLNAYDFIGPDTVNSSNSIPNSVAFSITSWNGFYTGINAGYGFGTSNNAQSFGWANPSANSYIGSVALALSNSYMGHDITQGGYIGGGQAGYNYLLSQKFIIGLETDMQGAGIGGQGNANGWAPYNQNNGGVESFVGLNPIQAGVNWMGTVRGRAGYLISPTVMTYVTAGLAYGGTYIKTFPTMIYASSIGGSYFDPVYVSTQNSQQNVNVGWTAGGGAEWMVAQNWSIKGEALYYNLGSTTVSNTFYGSPMGPDSFAGGSTNKAYYQGVISRVGVNYHFNLSTTPIVAKF